MQVSTLAGKPAEQNMLVNIPRLLPPITQENLIHLLPLRRFHLEPPVIAVLHSKTLSTKIIFLPSHKPFVFTAKNKKQTGLFIWVLIHMHCQRLLMLLPWKYWQQIMLK